MRHIYKLSNKRSGYIVALYVSLLVVILPTCAVSKYVIDRLNRFRILDVEWTWLIRLMGRGDAIYIQVGDRVISRIVTFTYTLQDRRTQQCKDLQHTYTLYTI